jgi:hypothetical protein
MRENVASGFVLGSARGLRAGFGGSPKRTSSVNSSVICGPNRKKSSRARGRARPHASRVRSPDPNSKIFFAATHFPSIFRAHRIRRVTVYYATGADFFVARITTSGGALFLENAND